MPNLTNSTFDQIDPDNFYNIQDESKYFTINDYNNIKFDPKTFFSLLNYNIRSFNANNESFFTFVHSLNYSFDCIVLTESWNNTQVINNCLIPNYLGFHTYRQNSRGGGVSIFSVIHLKLPK